MKKVGVLLSGCGVFDGAEIQEAVFALLALDQQGAHAVCCAPSKPFDVVDHTTHKPDGAQRNVLTEAARICRGAIRDVATVTAAEIDALILPGGFGVAKNLSTFAVQGADCQVDPAVNALITEMLTERKPIGAICIAPALLARVAGAGGIRASLTIGNDPATAGSIRTMGCQHQECAVTSVVMDPANRIVSTPAYMLAAGPAEVFSGISRLVTELLKLAGERR